MLTYASYVQYTYAVRRKRVKVDGEAFYHVVNRVHGQEYLFDAEASEEFCRIMRKVARFCGVEVITYCVMSNHIHLLVRVPKRKRLGDDELFQRFRALAARSTYDKLFGQFEHFKSEGNERGMRQIRDRLAGRMFDISAFMKELKQRFTQWYNSHNGCSGRGSFWSDRFKSVLVEGRGNALATIAAYIDLNPVRAKMVSDPKDHRWCGYAAALAGRSMALAGIKTLLGGFFRKGDIDSADVLAMYRMLLFGTALRKSGSITREQIEVVFAAEGMMPSWKVAQHRAAWISDGLIIGGRNFVEGLAKSWNEPLGLKRKRKFQDTPDDAGWCALRRSIT